MSMSKNALPHAFMTALAVIGVMTTTPAIALPPVSDLAPDWVRQFGTSSDDQTHGVSADTLGNVYVAGHTLGSLGGLQAGAGDVFLTKYNSSGATVWTRQFGTASPEVSTGVSVDSLGNVYINGWTRGVLDGVNAGADDAFVSRYDASGNRLWTRQLGTSGFDQSEAISADGLGNVYIAGTTDGSLGGISAGGNDAFLSKFDQSGNLLWTRQLGTSGGEFGNGLSVDGLGNVYLAGATTGGLMGANAGNRDSYVAKYDSSGNLQWVRQLGTGNHDETYEVAADNLGNVFVTGLTAGPLAGIYQGGADAYVIKYDSAGNLIWKQQLATPSNDEGHSVFADRGGGVYVSGYTQGTIGTMHVGGYDAFVVHYDTSGNLVWTHQLATAETDLSFGVSANSFGNVFVSGYTLSNLGGPNIGGFDVFVAKFTEVPEPAALSLGLLAVPILAAIRRRRRCSAG